jgi:hypothetical protein
MAVERTGPPWSHVEILDRVLDKGVVIDAWMQVSVVGIELIAVQARVVVASIETYVKESWALRHTGGAAAPLRGAGTLLIDGFAGGPTPMPPPRPAAPRKGARRRRAAARSRRRSR